jgi:hypothetical protein
MSVSTPTISERQPSCVMQCWLILSLSSKRTLRFHLEQIQPAGNDAFNQIQGQRSFHAAAESPPCWWETLPVRP